MTTAEAIAQIRDALKGDVGDAYNLLTQGESPTQLRGPSAQRIYDRARAAQDALDSLEAEVERLTEDAYNERIRARKAETENERLRAVEEAARETTFYGQEAHKFGEWHGSAIWKALDALETEEITRHQRGEQP